MKMNRPNRPKLMSFDCHEDRHELCPGHCGDERIVCECEHHETDEVDFEERGREEEHD